MNPLKNILYILWKIFSITNRDINKYEMPLEGIMRRILPEIKQVLYLTASTAESFT